MKSEILDDTSRRGRGWTRVVSLGLATPLALILLVWPMLMVGKDGHFSHGLLTLVLIGVCAGFVHGVGVSPQSPVMRKLSGPLLVWPLLALGYGLLVLGSQ